MDFSGGLVDKNPPANAGDMGWIPGPHRAPEPGCHNYSSHGLEPASHNYCACVPQLLKPVCSATRKAAAVRSLRTSVKSSLRLPQLQKPRAQQGKPRTATNKKIKRLKN